MPNLSKNITYCIYVYINYIAYFILQNRYKINIKITKLKINLYRFNIFQKPI